MGEALLGTSPGAEREARMEFWASYMRSYARPTSDTAWRRLRLSLPEYARLDDYDLYLANLPKWAAMYVDGHWSLEKFEAHADAMREAMFARSPQP